MQRIRFDILLTLLVGVVLLGSSTPGKAIAAGCQPSAKPGFNIDSQSVGSVVTLCAHYVADLTEPMPAQSPVKRSSKVLLLKPIAAPKPDPELAKRLLHRRLARDGASSFSPESLIIRANPVATLVDRNVELKVAHTPQFHTTYLVGHYASLRFIPLRIDFHFDASTRQTQRREFGGQVRFKKRGWHTIHGLVTYRAEYRLSGSKTWVRINGQQQLAAVSARVWVASKPGQQSAPSGLGSKPLLVANDCTLNQVLAGCLN